MAENRQTADYAAGAPGNFTVPPSVQNWWKKALLAAATGGPVIPHGPDYVPPKSAAQLAAEADYAAGAPGNADLGALVRPVPGRESMVGANDQGYFEMQPLIKPTYPFEVDKTKDSGAVAGLKGLGNTLWNLPGSAPNLGSTVFNTISGPWPGDKAVTNFGGGIVGSTVDHFTKPSAQAEADRLAPTAPSSLPTVPFDPTVPAGVDPRWIQASRWSGGTLSPAYFARTIGKEAGRRPDGSLDPTASNPKSSAAGLGQFTESTWLGVLRLAGPQIGLSPTVTAQIPLDGKMPTSALKTKLLALRNDPTASIWATAILGKANFDALARPVQAGGIGRAPTEDEVYLGHLLGPTTAAKIIMAPPGAPATAYVSPEAARANPTLFFRDGQPRSAGEFRMAQSAQWQGAGARSAPGMSISTTLPAPPMLSAVQLPPKPEIAAPPSRGTPMSVDYSGVQQRMAAAEPQMPLTPEDIAARKKSLLLSNILQGLAKGFIPGAIAGYGRGRDEQLAYEQGLKLKGEDARTDWNRWAVTPEGQVAEGQAANSNAIREADFLDRQDQWKVQGENADRAWDVQSQNAGATTANANANATNRWKWNTDVASASGVQVLGNGAVMVTTTDPVTGEIKQQMMDASEYMPGLRRQGATYGAFSGASVPSEVKTRLGALQVAASQGPDAMFMVVADEIAASPMADTILGAGSDKLRREAEVESRGDKKRAEGIFIAKIAAALKAKAVSDPAGLQRDMQAANQVGIVTAGGILGYTGR